MDNGLIPEKFLKIATQAVRGDKAGIATSKHGLETRWLEKTTLRCLLEDHNGKWGTFGPKTIRRGFRDFSSRECRGNQGVGGAL